MTVVLASVAFWAPVTINLPGDNGQLETLHFKGRFRRLKSSERKDLERRVRAFSMTPDKRQLLRKALDENLLPMTPREREEIEADLAAEPITDADVHELRELPVRAEHRVAVLVHAHRGRSALC